MTGTLCKSDQEVVKRWRGSGESKCQPHFGRKRKSPQRSNRALAKLFLADRKLTSKKLARELKCVTGVKLSASTVKDASLERSHC